MAISEIFENAAALARLAALNPLGANALLSPDSPRTPTSPPSPPGTQEAAALFMQSVARGHLARRALPERTSRSDGAPQDQYGAGQYGAGQYGGDHYGGGARGLQRSERGDALRTLASIEEEVEIAEMRAEIERLAVDSNGYKSIVREVKQAVDERTHSAIRVQSAMRGRAARVATSQAELDRTMERFAEYQLQQTLERAGMGALGGGNGRHESEYDDDEEEEVCMPLDTALGHVAWLPFRTAHGHVACVPSHTALGHALCPPHPTALGHVACVPFHTALGHVAYTLLTHPAPHAAHRRLIAGGRAPYRGCPSFHHVAHSCLRVPAPPPLLRGRCGLKPSAHHPSTDLATSLSTPAIHPHPHSLT